MSNTPFSSFSPEAKSFFVGGVRERATEKKVIFQRVAEFISATRLLRSRRSGDILLPFIVEKAPAKRVFRQPEAALISRRSVFIGHNDLYRKKIFLFLLTYDKITINRYSIFDLYDLMHECGFRKR
jgi:hypothetical protein